MEVLNSQYSKLVNYLSYKLNNKTLAEDMAQETFLKIYEKGIEFNEEKSSPLTWLITLANQVISDHFRAIKREKRGSGMVNSLDSLNANYEGDMGIDLLGCMEDHSINVFSIVDTNIKRDIIMKALKKISSMKIRHCLELHYFQDMRVEDISEILDIPLGSVKVYLTRGRSELFNLFKK